MTGSKTMMTISALSLILATQSWAQASVPRTAPGPVRNGQGEPLGNYEIGVVIDRYIGDPNIATTKITHDTMYIRRIFGAGDFFTGSAGSVLAPGQQTDLATLRAHDVTTLFKTRKELIFYIESGRGRLDDGKQFWNLSNGIAVMVPANIAHRLTNTSKAPLKMIMYSFDPSPHAASLPAIVVRNSHELGMIGRSVHWNNNAEMLFGPEVGVDRVMLVSFGPMTSAGPSASPAQSNPKGGGEQWIRVSSDGSSGNDDDMVMQLGSEVRNWPVNGGFVAPVNGQTVYGQYNVGETEEDVLVIAGGNPAAPTPSASSSVSWRSPPLPGKVSDPQAVQSYRDSIVQGRPLLSGNG